jgi:autotransporter-associated beta strand protein
MIPSSGFALHNITFTNENTSYTFSGQSGTPTFTLTHNVTANSGAGDVLLDSSIKLALSAASHVVCIADGVTITIDSQITDPSGPASVVKNGSGTLVLSGNNNFRGGLTVNDGKLVLGSSSDSGLTYGPVGTGTLTLKGGSNLTPGVANVTLANAIVLTATGDSLVHIDEDDSTNNLTLTGMISGTGGLDWCTDGTLTLTNAGNTFTGGFLGGTSVDLRAGTLLIGASSTAIHDGGYTVTSGPVGKGTLALYDGTTLGVQASTGAQTLHNAIELADGGTVTVDTSTGDLTLLGDITGSAELKKTGAGSLTLGGSGDFTGGVSVHAGTLFLASSSSGFDPLTGPVGSGTLKLYDGTTLAVAPSATSGIILANGILLDCTSSSNVTFDATSGNLTLLGSISGSAGITINAGTNSVLLNPDDSNSYGGPTLVNTGKLILGSDYALPNSTAVTVASGAILDLNGKNATVASLSGAGQVILTPGDGENSLTVGDGSSTTFSGVISGATVGDNYTVIEKVGSGTLTLSGANTFTGGLDLEEGTLHLGSPTVGSPGAIVSGPVGTGTLVLEDGIALVASIPNVVLANDINLDGGTFHLGDETATNLKLTGTIYGAGEIDFRGGSNGTLTLSGDNSFGGGVSVHSGTLLLGSSYELHSGVDIDTYTTGPVGAFGNSLKLYDGTTLGVAPSPPGTIFLANDIELDCRIGTNVNFDTTNGDLTIAGQISGTASLTKLGQGVLSLTNDNTYAGNTYINQGYVKLGNSGTSGSITGNVIFQGNTGLGGGELQFIRSDDYTFAGNITGPGRVTNFGTGTVTFSGSNTYSGGAFLVSGAFADGASGAFSPNSTFFVHGNTSLFVNHNETIAGLSNYTDQPGNIVTAGDVVVGSGATLTVNSQDNRVFSGVISGDGNLVKSGANSLTLGGANSYNGSTTVNGGTLALSVGGTLPTGSNLTLAGVSTAGILATQGTLGRTFGTGGNQVQLSGASGGGFAAYGGALNVALTGTWGTTSGFFSDGYGNLVFGDTQLADNVVTWSGAINLGAANRTIIVNDNPGSSADSVTISGVISNGGLIKSGSGTLTLSGINTYAGGTSIQSGLLVAGSSQAFGTGVVTLSGGALSLGNSGSSINLSFSGAGGTISGTGTILSTITAGPNVFLSPGNSPGTLTFTAGLVLASGGTLNFQVQDATGAGGTGYDLLAVSGMLSGPNTSIDVTATSGSQFTINLQSIDGGNNPGNAINFNPGTSYSWTFATAANGISGFASNKFSLDSSAFSNTLGGTFSITQSGNSLLLNFTPAAVPEPSTWALLVAGLGAVTVISRRRRRT